MGLGFRDIDVYLACIPEYSIVSYPNISYPVVLCCMIVNHIASYRQG